MTSVHVCPSCGESAALRGAPGGAGIEITCQTCGHRWTRGALTCRSCGGAESVTIPQVIARTTRGTQLSIMGHRDAVLCPVCDADVIAQCQTARQWVPENHVSAFAFDAAENERSQNKSAPTASEVQRARPRPTAPRQPAQPVELLPEEPAKKNPTVRQAVEAYMGADPEADALTMLSLATFLGSSTRLETLAGPQSATTLGEWFDSTWGEHHADRQSAVRRSVRAAFAHWVAEGWIADDPSMRLGA